MAFGLLGSIIPQINRNEVFYTSEISNVAFGKVSISNKNYNPAKIRLGITEDDINIEYLEYNRFINYGETFESETIYVGNGQKLVARSNDSNVNFLFYGETVNEGGNPNISGLLSSVVSTNTQKKVLYTAPANSNVLVTLSVCNLGSIPSKARIGLSNAGLNSFDSTEYLEYDVEIGPNQTYTRTDIKLNQNQTIICSSSEDSNINFVCHGRYFYGSLSNDLNVTGDARINGNLGIGTNYRSIEFSQTVAAPGAPGTSSYTFTVPTTSAVPGETIFSFIGSGGGGNTASLDLTQLKELNNTPVGGRGTFPNGPDVLAINVYTTSGSQFTGSLVLRWGEAQA